MYLYHVTSIGKTTKEVVLCAIVAARSLDEVDDIMLSEGLTNCDEYLDTSERVYLLGFGADGLEAGVIICDYVSSEINEDDFDDNDYDDM